jgi:putative transposase
VVIIRGAVSPDHVHMLVSAPPRDWRRRSWRKYIKGRWREVAIGAVSSPRLEEFEELRKRYWRLHPWARRYFCASVGAGDEETITKYIESQHWDDDAEGFKITAPTKP